MPIRSGAAAMGLAGALALTGASAASASPAGGYPTPNPQPQPKVWTFDGQSSDIGSILPTLVNRVDGQGALAFQNWRIRDLSPNVSVFSLGGNSITLWHSAQPLPEFNFRTCTVIFGPQVGHFRILAPTGIFAGFRSVGLGTFVEQGLVSLPLIRGKVCALAFANPWAVRLAVIKNAINGVNGPVAGQLPTLLDFAFQGRGLVAAPLPAPTPCPTGPGGIFAPVNPSLTPSPYVSPSATVGPTTSAKLGGYPTPHPTGPPTPSPTPSASLS